MAIGLRFTGGQTAAAATRFLPVADITIDIVLTIDQLPAAGQTAVIMRNNITNPVSNSFFVLRVDENGVLFTQCGWGAMTITSPSAVITAGQEHTISLVFTGLNPTSDATQGTYELFVDTVSQGTTSPRSEPFRHNTMGVFGGGVSNSFAFMTLYSVDVTTATYNYAFSGDNSNTSGGAQPVMLDSIAANTLVGTGFATDGSAWVSNATKSLTAPATAAPATTINYTVANAGPITQARLTRGTAVLTLGSVTDTSAAVPALADGLNIIPFGTGAQLELWDGTEWLTAPIEFTQPVGQGVVTLAGTLNTTNTGFLFNYGGTPVAGDQFVNANTDLTLAANGNITSDVDGTYTIYAIDVSDAQPTLEAFTVIVAEQVVVDTTPPTLTSGSSSSVTQTTATVSVSTDEGNGTLYHLRNNQASATVATVKAGSSQAVTAVGVQTINQTGLTANTQYYVHIVHTDAAGNDSTVTTVSFTTEAEIISPPVITVSGQAITTIDFGGVLPTFTATTNDGSPVVVSGDTPVNNVAGTYVIRYNSSNAGGAATEVTRTVIVEAQITAPSLFLFGGDVFLEFGVNYVEPGFQALDAIDGDITASVVTSGTVDNQTPARYRIDYSVTNSNNLTTTVSRFVTVRNQHGQQEGFLYARRFPWQKRI